MDACGCDDFARVFDRRTAERDRDRYRRGGADTTTRMLLDLLRPYGVAGASVLDVGGGIGVIVHELLREGASHAVLVDASPAYVAVARQLARERNELDRLEIVDGDFTRAAAGVGAADLVALDRVVCCFGDVERLVRLSAARARRAYALVLPRDRWFIRAGIAALNVVSWIRREPYRAYAHANARVDELVAAEGLRPRDERRTMFWRVVVYDRAAA
jgi:magnesium-protoporphyrin O-methyltransferase